MLLHVDNTKFKVKPTGAEIGGIKARFTKSASIKDITVKQLADCLTAGKTVQPGVTPFSEESRKKGYKGTNDADFTRQTVFIEPCCRDGQNIDFQRVAGLCRTEVYFYGSYIAHRAGGRIYRRVIAVPPGKRVAVSPSATTTTRCPRVGIPTTTSSSYSA